MMSWKYNLLTISFSFCTEGTVFNKIVTFLQVHTFEVERTISHQNLPTQHVINFVLHFMVTLFRICFSWLTSNWFHVPGDVLISVTNRKNAYAKCVAYVPWLESFMITPYNHPKYVTYVPRYESFVITPYNHFGSKKLYKIRRSRF